MTLLFGSVNRDEVTDHLSFAKYVQQQLGVPLPVPSHYGKLLREVNKFFVSFPNSNYRTLTKLVDWAKAKRLHPVHSWVVLSYFRYAYSDGYLPEFDPDNQ